VEKHEIILAAEETFVREVALGVIVKQPRSIWHSLIPGMFIIDFLRRTSKIRKYTHHFIFARKQSLDAAQDIIDGEVKSDRLWRAEEEIRAWLTSLNLYSEELLQGQMSVVRLLVDHYAKLLQGEGDTYYSLVRNGYENRENYELYLSRLASLEGEMDRAIVDKSPADENLKQRLLTEQQEVENRRQKHLDEIF